MSTFPFKIQPILSWSSDKAISNLIRINNLNLLFDCGWNETFPKSTQQKYNASLSDIKLDAIFLTNNYITYFGALPLIMSYPKNTETKIYSTTPIAKLGIYIMADAYISALESQIKPFDFDIDEKNFSKNFFSIKDWKFQQTLKLPAQSTDEAIPDSTSDDSANKDNILLITPLPSGYSIGGCIWKITYKLYTWIYAPHFSIEPKLITDPFPYSSLSNINYFITDTIVSHKSSVIKSVIESEFKKKLIECFDWKKNIFIPSDSVNITWELLIRIEKILDEYYSNNKNEKLIYKVLVCSHCSSEIIEGVKSWIEFLGTSISQQFYSYNVNPFNFQYVTCVKDIKEYAEIINKKEDVVSGNNVELRYWSIASFSKLNVGMSHNILPYVIQDPNTVLLIVHDKFDIESVWGRLCFQYNNKEFDFDFEERNVIERMVIKDDRKDIENQNQERQKERENKQKENDYTKNKEIAWWTRKKLFAKSEYLMFSYVNKTKFSDYGIEWIEKEKALMRRDIVHSNDNYQSGFKEYLDNKTNNNNNDTNSKAEFRFKLSQYPLPTKITINNIKLQIKCEILSYAMITEIDWMSKEIILKELSPSQDIILLSSETEIARNNSWIIPGAKYATFSKPYEKEFPNFVIKFKYDSSFLWKGKHLPIQNSATSWYDYNSVYLKIKRQRDVIKDIALCEAEYNKSIEKLGWVSARDNNECFYVKEKWKWMSIKMEIEKVSNEKFYIKKHTIVNESGSIVIKLENGELLWEGELSQDYISIRNFIYNYYMDMEQ